MDDVWGQTTDDDWFGGIGRLVVAAAEMEAAFGTLLCAVRYARTDRLTPGTLESLGRELWKEVGLLDDRELLQARLIGELNGLVSMRARRNDVIHGWWRWGADHKTALRARASRSQPDLSFVTITYNDLSHLMADIQMTRNRVLRLAMDITGELSP